MSIFEFLLKKLLRQPAAPPVAESRTPAAARAKPTAPATPVKPVDRRLSPRQRMPQGSSILIIDDSKTMVAALGNMLRQNNFTIFEALDGEAGLEVLRKQKPSLIFLDLVLPGISGFDVLRRIRRSPYVGKVPVIAMSGNEAATEEYYVRRIGADDFMHKPCTRAEVFSRVERLLSLKPNALSSGPEADRKKLPHD
jgi:DNA-binding response OmpR family regulator